VLAVVDLYRLLHHYHVLGGGGGCVLGSSSFLPSFLEAPTSGGAQTPHTPVGRFGGHGRPRTSQLAEICVQRENATSAVGAWRRPDGQAGQPAAVKAS
jgi:hypothetical protein